jgi:hypothetical protein
MEKFYLNADNTYWGSMVDSHELPFVGAVEVPFPPDKHAKQVWNSGTSSYGDYTDPIEASLALFNGLNVSERAAYSTYKQLISDAVKSGDKELALYILNNINVPSDKQSIKDQIVTYLGSL